MKFQIADGRVFSLGENNELLAETTYVSMSENEVDIDHTYVNPVLRGQGVAGQMMETLAAHLRERGLRAGASCSYANNWLRKNKEAYGDIISDTLFE